MTHKQSYDLQAPLCTYINTQSLLSEISSSQFFIGLIPSFWLPRPILLHIILYSYWHRTNSGSSWVKTWVRHCPRKVKWGKEALKGQTAYKTVIVIKKKNYQSRQFLLYFPLLLQVVHQLETEWHHVDHHSSGWLYWPLWHFPACLTFHCSHWVLQNIPHPARRGKLSQNRKTYAVFTFKTNGQKTTRPS